MARLLLATVVLLGAATSHAVTAPHSFEYLYVESNTGDASGGHAAICFAAQCYHFQQDEAGTIRLHRDDAAEFDYRYRLLGNRTIHVSQVDVASATYDQLRAAFQLRVQVQDRQTEQLRSLTRDRALLEEIARGDSTGDAPAAISVELPGSAYFVADSDTSAARWAQAPRAAAIEELAERIGTVYGEDYIERRAAVLKGEIAALEPATDAELLPEAGRLPVGPPGFATRHRELLSGWLAMEVLRAAPPLRRGSFHTAASVEFALAPAEVEVLRGAAHQQADALVQLLASPRPDWGYAMLVGMARLLALHASIDTGTLIVLDDFSEQAATVAADVVAEQQATLMQVRDERRADFVAARRAFFAGAAHDERGLSTVEVTANLLVDIESALAGAQQLRLYTGGLVPTKGARRNDWPLPALSGETATAALATAREREAAYRAALAHLYPYELLTRNCVTEIFRTMDGAFAAAAEPANAADTARAASRAALGGYVDWHSTLNFIPFVSATAVEQTYHVAAHSERPSYRHLALENMARHESRWRVGLRESNVLTAHTYGHNHDDPLFLFFTDDTLALRPLYGIANLVVGVGGSLAGLVWAPFDGGATLRTGLNGALFSLPELAFVNIRKGSFAFAPRRWLDDEAEALPETPLTQVTRCQVPEQCAS